MSDDQEIVDGITGSLSRSQTAKELESQLLQLRKGALLQNKKKSEKRISRTLSRMQLELPTIQPASVHVRSKGEACTSTNYGTSIRAKDERRKPGPASSELQSIALRGNNFKSATKPPGTNSFKSNNGTEKREVNCFENLENTGTLKGFCGPYFRPWSRGKKAKRKHFLHQDGYNQQEVNFQRFYSKHQRSKSDCFNLSEVLREVTEITRFNENHAKKAELVPMTTSSDILLPEPMKSQGFPQEDCLLNDSEVTWTAPKKVIPVKKEQRLKKLLRRQLISCYDLGPVIEPFDVIVGEKLSHKNPQCGVKLPDLPRGKQDIFPFAVPYLRLPLLPSSRNELVKISHVLTKCEVFPWQLQNIKLKYRRGRVDLNTTTRRQQTSREDNENIESSTKDRDKAALCVFVPASN